MKKKIAKPFDVKKRGAGIAAFCILIAAVCLAGNLTACRFAGASSSGGASSGPGSFAPAVPAGTASAGSSGSPVSSKSAASGGFSADSSAASGAVLYKNTRYGFEFTLPESWKGYQLLSSQWSGIYEGTNKKATGPEIIIRSPKWTQEKKWVDIPILVFTQDQWAVTVKSDLEQKKEETLYIGAGPGGPQKLGQNSKYVFALPFRYDFAADAGFDDVHAIIDSNPLKPTEQFR
ncbi:MAG: hypothetical protein GX424_07765 [Clostridiales bacterium]|nr:hypothetical protein [Clostridiales bacterium]